MQENEILRVETGKNVRPTNLGIADPEFELVGRAASGEQYAFKELFGRHGPRIYSFCLRISSDSDIADELTQIVFIKAWEKLNTFKFGSKFSTWLHSIAMNEYLSFKRAGKTFTEKLSELFRKNEERKTIAGRTDARIDLEYAISKLPEQSRLVVILHDVEGYKHEEISKMLNIATGTSKAALHRARKQLRKELSK
jgi:RNA polymerase sigma-70 factor (ECF subfamily)